MTQTWQHLEIYADGEQVPGFGLYGVGGPDMPEALPSAPFDGVRFCDSFVLVSDHARVLLWHFSVSSWERSGRGGSRCSTSTRASSSPPGLC